MTEREAVVAEARTWLGTPYHHRGRVKGAGVDCALLVMESFVGAGLAERFDPGFYTHDWHLHRGEERYLEIMQSHMTELDTGDQPLRSLPNFSPQPADVLMWRYGRTYSHAAIVTQWPYIIHSFFPARMVIEEIVLNTPLAVHPMKHFSYWGNS